MYTHYDQFMPTSGTGRIVVRKGGNKRPAGEMMNGMGKESRRKEKNRVCNGRLFVGCVDLSSVVMETKQKALEWAIYLELLKVVALSVLRLQSLRRGENKDNVQSKAYSFLEYCYYYYCFLRHNNYHSIFLISISFPHFFDLQCLCN